MYRKFKPLNIPDGWEQYWSKYPNGYTIMEALIDWVSQVDDMVANQNELTDTVKSFGERIDEFINQFGAELQKEVQDLLSEWQDSGFLNIVISEALQWELDDFKATTEQNFLSVNQELQQKVHLISFKRENGELDDTGRLQRAIDYATINKKKLINGDGKLVLDISKPIYVYENTKIDFGGAALRKTTNVLGEGSNTSTNGVVDNYNVDAAIIVKHDDGRDTFFLEIENLIIVKKTDVNKLKYGIFAPRLARSEMENIWIGYGVADYGVYGYQWWLIPRFSNIRQDEGLCTWTIANDGSGIGQSTSIQADQIIGVNQNRCFSIYGVSYSTINTPLIDYAKGEAFAITSCRGITINSPSVEHLISGKFIRVEDSNVVINTPNGVEISGSTTAETYLLNIRESAKVTINNGRFTNYKDGTPSLNYPLVLVNNSHLILNSTDLPSNGNSYIAKTNGSTYINNNANGMLFSKDNSGTGIVSQNARFKTGIGTTLPTTGEWKKGDIFFLENNTLGRQTEYYCLASEPQLVWRLKTHNVLKAPSYGRPTSLSEVHIGLIYFDTEIKKPIWWDGAKWVDGVGGTV